jgi:hypothetical protein
MSQVYLEEVTQPFKYTHAFQSQLLLQRRQILLANYLPSPDYRGSQAGLLIRLADRAQTSLQINLHSECIFRPPVPREHLLSDSLLLLLPIATGTTLIDMPA